MGVPVATITCAGKPLDPEVELLELEVRRELNRVPEAKLTLLDGSVAKRAFEISDRDSFVPGSKITVAMRFEGDPADTKLFAGVVVRHRVEASSERARLHIEAKDHAHVLTRGRKSATFPNQTDRQVVEKLLGDANLKGGQFDDVSAPKEPELVQYNTSDWDFIVSRAEVTGRAVNVHLGELSLRKLALSAPVTKLEYGLGGVQDFELELDGAEQVAGLEAVGWDPGKQALTTPKQGKDPRVKAGNLDGGKVAADLQNSGATLLHPVALKDGELQALADARLLQSRLAFLRGRVTVDGDGALAPLDTVTLGGIGDRFNGNALVSGVTHKVDHGGWRTELQVGLAPAWFASKPDVLQVPAGGMLPSMANLQLAKVAKFKADPLGEQRIQVALPALAKEPFWARAAQPEAGKNRGSIHWPEEGDEVVLGFLNGDPRAAVVLGSLFGSVAKPPAALGAPSQDNFTRGFVSKQGTSVVFDDEKVTVRVETPGGNRVVIDDDAKSITVEDPHGNEIVLGDKGITLKSASDFNIDAAGKVVIKGSTVDIQ